MTEWADDVRARLVSQGVCSLGTTLFVGLRASLPDDDGPFVCVIPTPGTNPDYIQNEALPAYLNPGAQITVTGKNPTTTRAMATSAYKALVVTNATVNGTWYRWIRPQQEPADLMVDAKGRLKLVFNILASRRGFRE